MLCFIIFLFIFSSALVPLTVKAQGMQTVLTPVSDTLFSGWSEMWAKWEAFKFEAETPSNVADTQTAINTAQKNVHDSLMTKLKSVGVAAAKAGLGYFLNKIAYDTATWLATGDEGQQPMWRTEGWGAYLSNTADEAAGTFLESLGQENDWMKFNLCNPDFGVKAVIGLGLNQSYNREPKKPTCSFSKMKENWSQQLHDPNFLSNFQAYFDPWENDVGIAFDLNTGILEKQAEETAAAKLEKLDESAVGGWKKLTSWISGDTKLPPGGTAERVYQMFGASTDKELTWSDDPFGISNAIGVFANTLIGKLNKKLFSEGLIAYNKGEQSSSSGSGVYSYEAESSYGGVAAARLRFSELLEAGFSTGGPYEILQQLTACSDPNNPGVTDCVIEERFRQAIENKTQVRDLDPDILQRPFGVIGRSSDTGEALEPSYKEGFPLRSLIILRKYRIIPVGWELAAQYISKFDDRTYNLADLVAINDPSSGRYDEGSPFFGLIDPNWVLKAPENYCRRKGPGPDIININTAGGYDANKDGDYEDEGDKAPYVSLYRNENYCADEQSCIVENDDGTCRFYGYCTEEKRTWNFDADNCSEQFNTCQSFAARNGTTASYLKDSLEYNGCNIDNVGCWWYCQDYDEVSGNWACASPGWSYRKCDNPNGCEITRSCNIPKDSNQCYSVEDGTLLVRTVTCVGQDSCPFEVQGDIPLGATQVTVPACSSAANLLQNSGFESGTEYDAANWKEPSDSGTNNNAYHRRVKKSEAHSGNYVLESYTTTAGQSGGFSLVTTSDPIQIDNPGRYILSGWIYNNLNGGTPFADIVDTKGNSVAVNAQCTTSAGFTNGSKVWSQFFCQFEITSPVKALVRLITKNASNGRLNGTLWFDDIKLQENCLGQAVTLYNGNSPKEYKVEQPNNDIYFDAQAASCSYKADGCSEMIRTKPGLGTNLVPNGSFDYYDGTIDDKVTDKIEPWNWLESKPYIQSDSFSGQTSIKLDKNILKQTIDLGAPAQGKILSFSFWAKAAPGASDSTVTFYLEDTQNDKFANGAISSEGMTGTVNGDWQRFFTAAVLGDPNNADFSYPTDNKVAVVISTGSSILIDGVQLEELSGDQIDNSQYYTSYHDYGSVNELYIKKAPDYYNCQGYTSSRPGLNGEIDPAVCLQYAQMCFADEVDCQWYTPLDGDPRVPAIAKYPVDYCPDQCAGYQTYKQEPTNFEVNGDYPLYFIAKTAKSCQAQYSGCDEFTNLDEVAKGGEALEYYSDIRECQKPAPTNSDCSTYYTWVGSDLTGYQLQVYQLKKGNVKGGPCTVISYNQPGQEGQPVCLDKSSDYSTKNDPKYCNENTYLTNPDCRQFYDDKGNVTYRFFTKTISCSDDCHPYRKTISEENDCKTSGGYWNSTNEECIYYAIPSEGKSCPANASGCRTYTGNAGKNIANVLYDDFEDGTNENWVGGENNPESVNVGGHSLKVSNKASKEITSLITADKAYLVEFWAKGNGQNNITIQLGHSSQYEVFNNETITLTNQWKKYTLGPVFVSWSLADKEYLSFDGNGDYYLDNIILKEVTDSIFVIKDSWQTPAACDNDYFDPYGQSCESSATATNPARCSGLDATRDEDKDLLPIMLGCEGYNDSADNNLYLKSFDHLCREEAVGCELMIDTHNSTSPLANTWNAGDKSEIAVPSDEKVYMVNDKTKYCDAEDKGCLGLGRPVIGQNDEVKLFQTVYLKNNPDQYDNIMCLSSEVGCDEFKSGPASYFFKDPGNKVCDYKAMAGNNSKTWYKRGTADICPIATSQLGIDYPSGSCLSLTVGQVCSNDSQCGDYAVCDCLKDEEDNTKCYKNPGICQGKSCLNNTDCQKLQDAKNGIPNDETKDNYCINWAGVCPAGQSGCTEFIDPLSPFAKNLVFNGTFEQNLDGNNLPDGWLMKNNGLKTSDDSASQGYNNSHGVLAVFGGALTNDKQVFYQQNFVLEPNTLYTISAYIKKQSSSAHAVVGMYNCRTSLDKNGKFNDPVGVNSPDSSMMVVKDKNYKQIYFLVDNNKLSTDEYREFSGRFYSGDLYVCEGLVIGAISGSIVNGNLQITNPSDQYHWFDNVAVRKTGVYYKINDNNLDKTSCNGQVDFNKGCVLLNDRSAINWQKGEGNNDYLVFDADQSPAKNGAPQAGCDSTSNDGYSEQCDSNLLLKVTPDRTCEEWLYCQSSMATINDNGQKENMCFDIGLCNSVDEQGKCDGLPSLQSSGQGNQTYQTAEIDKIKNLSGYAKAGIDWGSNKIIEGDYPVYQMEQTGSMVNVPNGDFELADSTGQPTSWYQQEDLYGTEEDESLDWSPAYFKVVDDPIEAEDNGVCYKSVTPCLAPQGKNFLKLNGIAMATSEFINVTTNTDYIISAYINSHWLSQGHTGIAILEYKDSDNVTGVCVPASPYGLVKDSDENGVKKTCITDDDCSNGHACKNWYKAQLFDSSITEAGQDWGYKVHDFKTNSETKRIKLKLFNFSDGNAIKNVFSGSSYYDDIQIKPVLKTRDLGNNKSWYTTRDCRLYPEKTSLSCEYTDDQNSKHKGWRGYCLEYDKTPGNTDSCLLWWPVDIIWGEYWGAEYGYNDRYPLYYCLSAKANDVVGGYCAVKNVASNNYYNYQTGSSTGQWCPTGSMANCGGCVLGGDGGYMIVDFGIGFRDGGDPNDPTDDPYVNWDQGICPCVNADESKCDESKDCAYFNHDDFGGRWDLTIDAGCGSGLDNSEVLVSNDLNNWISVGNFKSGAIQCGGTKATDASCNNAFEGNCCPEGGCKDGQSNWRCGCEAVDGHLKFKFDFKGTKAEGNIFRYVKVLSKGFSNPANDTTGAGPEVGGLLAYHEPASCEWLAQTVTPSGDNKAWLDRVSESSNYIVTTTGQKYSDDWPPFGGVIPPEPVGNPSAWDGRSDDDFPGKQKLYQEPQDTKNYKTPYQARAGVPYYIAPGANGIDKPEEGKKGVMQLFAESYGVWKWGGNGLCADGSNNGGKCERDDCPGGACELTADFHCTAIASSNSNDYRCQVNQCPGGTCKETVILGSNTKIAECDGGDYTGKTCCLSNWGVCGEPDTSKTPVQYYGVCSKGSPNFGEPCQVNSNCGTGGVCQGVAEALCKLGDNDGKSCLIDDCPGGTCDFQDLRYYSSAQYNWSPPTSLCTRDKVGFVRDRNGVNDIYCSIPPYIDNFMVNGKSGDNTAGDKVEIHGGGGFATLTFTSHVDANQLPISGYQIDWGDFALTKATGIKINQKQSPNNPHIFYHYFNYWDIQGKMEQSKSKSNYKIECGTGPDGNYCVVYPKIQIVDNWNWCNHATLPGRYGNYCDDMLKNMTYTEFGGGIYVYER